MRMASVDTFDHFFINKRGRGNVYLSNCKIHGSRSNSRSRYNIIIIIMGF